MVYLGYLTQSLLVGVAAYALYHVLYDGLEEIGNRLVKAFTRKRPTLRHALLRSGAVRKV